MIVSTEICEKGITEYLYKSVDLSALSGCPGVWLCNCVVFRVIKFSRYLDIWVGWSVNLISRRERKKEVGSEISDIP